MRDTIDLKQIQIYLETNTSFDEVSQKTGISVRTFQHWKTHGFPQNIQRLQTLHDYLERGESHLAKNNKRP